MVRTARKSTAERKSPASVSPWDSLRDSLVASEGLRTGSVFGHPGLKDGTKLVACLFGEDLVVKLPEESVEKALALGGKHFDPMGGGRPMKNWVQIPPKASKKWKGFARESLLFVRALR